MKLNYNGLKDRAAWEKAGVQLPKHDWQAMRAETEQNPTWVHFGAGNIFRIFIAGLQQRLLDAGEVKGGIIAVETFDPEVVERVYEPHDSMTLAVSLRPDGGVDKAVNASIAKGIVASSPEGWAELKAIFRKPSLQLISFTITEKGYALRDMKGELTPVAAADIEAGPAAPRHAMGVVASLLLEHFNSGATPIAVVSMDNCSHNGEKLRAGVTEIARAWAGKGFVPAAYIAWLEDETKVSFPWSMIDKITPRPAEDVERRLAALGIEDMAPIVTAKRTYIAPFVNAEIPQYLVIEDRFPNGRPPLEKAGVYLTDRDTVNMTERMKVTTCLNPLHTALAVYGCLLGYEKICDEMKDEDLVKLVRRIGYTEGLPVVTDPGILSPKAFIDEVVEQRLPNPFMPDTPQRIACDTSQKVPIRFGETIKSYAADPQRDPASLVAIPLALAGWLRYLLGVDDRGNEMPVSPDPMLAALQGSLEGVKLGEPDSADGKLDAILTNPNLFGVNLAEVGLAGKVEGYFRELLAGPGAVRATLKKYL
ncbi:MAG: mannitol dehydrogenase family protein [Clostridia bacterium]|nr:mannitol dehydrogenase family protein [Clostridia bacterium]